MKRSLQVLALILSAAIAGNATLIHHYTFDGNVEDQGTGSSDGTLINGATALGGVLSLSAAGSQYVDFTDHLVPTSGSWTVSLLERTSGPQSTITEMISQGSSSGPGFYIGTDGGSGVRLTDSWGVGGVFPAADSQWHQIVLVYNGDYSLYIDGSFVSSSGAFGNAGGSGSDTRFGRQFAPYGEFFNGDLADVRIYNTALSGREIAGLPLEPGASSVPEPASLSLIGLGAAAILGLRRRR